MPALRVLRAVWAYFAVKGFTKGREGFAKVAERFFLLNSLAGISALDEDGGNSLGLLRMKFSVMKWS